MSCVRCPVTYWKPLAIIVPILSGFIVCEIAVLLYFFGRCPTPPTIPPLSSFEECAQPGLHGILNPNAIATIILLPKPESSKTRNTGGLRHLKYQLYSRSLLSHRINFVFATSHCPTMRLIRRFGFATIVPESGNAVSDLTYRHAFQLVNKYGASSPIVGFTNSDIIFYDNMVTALEQVHRQSVARNWTSYFMTGVRRNVDVGKELMPIDKPIDGGTWDRFVNYTLSNGRMFQSITADYFLWSSAVNYDFDRLPPFLIGGVAFDNYFVGVMSATRGIVTINLTPSVDAVHVNHGGGEIYASHFSPGSTFNSAVFDKTDMLGSCDVQDLDWAIVTSKEGDLSLRKQ